MPRSHAYRTRGGRGEADDEAEAVRTTIRSNHLELNVLGPQPADPSPLAALVRERLVRSNVPLSGEGEAMPSAATVLRRLGRPADIFGAALLRKFANTTQGIDYPVRTLQVRKGVVVVQFKDMVEMEEI